MAQEEAERLRLKRIQDLENERLRKQREEEERQR